jgi:CrcB protein
MHIIYIAAGGAVGAIARHLLALLLGKDHAAAGTLTANLLGCFLLGFILTISLDILTISSELRTGVAVGFIGALTTFSTLMVQVMQYVFQNRFREAVMYLIISFFVGLASAYAGAAVAGKVERIKPARDREGEI